MQQMYHPSDLAAMDPLVLMKNLDHVRMTSRRLSYILQQQVHLYTPEANQLREQIDRYVEAERQIEGEMARRRIRAVSDREAPRTRRSPARQVTGGASRMSAVAGSGPGRQGHEADGRLRTSGPFGLLRGDRRRVDHDRGLDRRCRLRLDPDLERRSGCASATRNMCALTSASAVTALARSSGGSSARSSRRRATQRLLLGDDLASERRERRHLEQPEPDPSGVELVRRPAVEQATAGDGAHLVVQLRPAHASAGVAEADELDGVGRETRVAAGRATIDGVPSLSAPAARTGKRGSLGGTARRCPCRPIVDSRGVVGPGLDGR